MRWYVWFKSNDEQLQAILAGIGIAIIILLQLYIILAEKKVEFFVDTEKLYELFVKNIHCPVCHPKGV